MKIDINSGYGVYGKKVAKGNEKVKSSSEGSVGSSKKAADGDVVEISRGNTTIADKSFMALKANLQREINQPASSERLEQLRASIKNGSYRIPTETLIDSILGD